MLSLQLKVQIALILAKKIQTIFLILIPKFSIKGFRICSIFSKDSEGFEFDFQLFYVDIPSIQLFLCFIEPLPFCFKEIPVGILVQFIKWHTSPFHYFLYFFS